MTAERWDAVPVTAIPAEHASRRSLRGRPSATLTRNVAPGVHRLEHAFVNCYLIEDGDDLTLVDAAFPATWAFLQRSIAELGRRPSDVRAVVLTHAHFDHLGVAARVQREWGIPIMAHAAEAYIARHPYRYAHENSRLLWPIRHPAFLPVVTRMAAAGALAVPGIAGLTFFSPGDVLDVPGRPEVVFCPGHTFGHCALHLRDRSVLIGGDALVTFNPYTGESGPQIVSGAATADSVQALTSLQAMADTGADILLPGHGDPWRAGIRSAVDIARAKGKT